MNLVEILGACLLFWGGAKIWNGSPWAKRQPRRMVRHWIGTTIILLVGSFFVTYPQQIENAVNINQPFPTATPTATQEIILTSTIPPIPTAAATSTTAPTETVFISDYAETQFEVVENYFQAINEERFADAWTYLHPVLAESVHPGGFNEFVDFWTGYKVYGTLVEDKHIHIIVRVTVISKATGKAHNQLIDYLVRTGKEPMITDADVID